MMVIGFLSSHTNKTTFYFILCFHVLYSNVTFFIEHDLSPDEMWQPFTLAIGIPVLNLVIFINKQLKILSDFHCVLGLRLQKTLSKSEQFWTQVF